MRQWSNLFAIILLLFFSGYSHFYNLSKPPFSIYDEARLATSAYEMTQTGNLIVTTLGYNPDLIGTKPPLMIWAQAACIRWFGINEFAVRLPAALCALLTIFLVFLFVLRVTGSSWSALLSGIVLCTAHSYLFDHGTRPGRI